MPSPFPGMNPYLEQEDVWHDFHQSFIPLLRELLAAQLSPAYVVKVEEQLYVHELSADERLFLGRADVGVAGTRPAALASSRATAQAPAYATIVPAVDLIRRSFIQIRDRQSRDLITVVEFLSPSNKRVSGDREQFLAKRRQILNSPVHFVEIDFLRGGPRMPMEDLPDCDYYVMVSRAEERPRAGVWPIRLRERLPTIPIPVRTPDPDATVDLQVALNRLYDVAGYHYYIYAGNPQPPLHPDDAAWARQFLPPAADTTDMPAPR